MYFEFESAVRGYRYYRRFWSPTENEVLNFFHERRNPFDVFAAKTCLNGNPKAFGHLPREISRLTNFILDRGAEVEATLTSKHYRRSPLTQSVLEMMPCMVKVAIPGTLLNKKLLERYEEIVTDLYVESAIIYQTKVQLRDLLFLTTPSWEISQGVVNRGNRSQKRRKKNATREM